MITPIKIATPEMPIRCQSRYKHHWDDIIILGECARCNINLYEANKAREKKKN